MWELLGAEGHSQRQESKESDGGERMRKSLRARRVKQQLTDYNRAKKSGQPGIHTPVIQSQHSGVKAGVAMRVKDQPELHSKTLPQKKKKGRGREGKMDMPSASAFWLNCAERGAALPREGGSPRVREIWIQVLGPFLSHTLQNILATENEPISGINPINAERVT